ncbi:metal ABC transporter permease, partial [Acidocella sp.]|uniref:metal ABC transporter permease n=1 Tax=Acidocella sp. TaxID=50710 RepID=UPI00260E7AEE
MLGFFQSGPVQVALALGGAAALLGASLGLFAVLRGQAFAGHALADVSSAGGAGSLLLGWTPLPGFLLFGLLGAAGLAALRARHA